MSSSFDRPGGAGDADLLIEVVIPVKDDWERLGLALAALERQSLGEDRWGIIIVDNGSSTPAPSGIRIPANARIICESTPGSYAARNAGIRASTAPFLAFTDADCLPDEEWLQVGVEFLERSGGRVAGEILVFAQNDPATFAELHEMRFAFTQRDKVARGVAATANFFVDRAKFETLGLFDHRLSSGGDFEWNRRATRAGVPVEFAKNAIVRHPARSTLAELLEKDRRVWSGKLAFREYPGPVLIAIALQRGLIAPLLAAPQIVFGQAPAFDNLATSRRAAFVLWMVRARLKMLRERLRLMRESRRAVSSRAASPSAREATSASSRKRARSVFARRVTPDHLSGSTPEVLFWVVRPTQETLCRSLIRNLPDDVRIGILRRSSQTPSDGSWPDAPPRFGDTIAAAESSDLSALGCSILVTPETWRGHLRPPAGSRVIHLPHSPVSLHAAYPSGAFARFDALFAAGPHHAQEFSALNRQNKLSAISAGYLGFATIRESLRALEVGHRDRPEVVIAPSWHRESLLTVDLETLILQLLGTFAVVHLRPHYKSFESSVRRDIEKLSQRFADEPRFRLEQPGHGGISLLTADVMIADYSGVAIEFAAVRQRPVVFADLPVKQRRRRLPKGLPDPLEWRIREEIGLVVPSDPKSLASAASICTGDFDEWRDRITQSIGRNFYNSEDPAGATALALVNLL